MTPANIPAELRALRQWIVWRLEAVEGRGKPAKVPYVALSTGAGVRERRAKTNDPADWTSFEVAEEAVRLHGFAGVGFVFTGTDYVGIDLDGAIGDDGVPGPNSLDILRLFPGAYAEVSQSGHGLHIIVKGALPPGAKRRGPVEAYDRGSPRYFALTGDVFGERCDAIPQLDSALLAFHARWLGDSSPETVAPQGVADAGQKASLPAKVSDSDPRVAALVDAAVASSAGFSALYNFGETRPGKSASESDSWMARELAKHERDPQVILAAMQASALARPKWNERRPKSPTGTVIGLAIADALRAVPERKSRGHHATVSVSVADVIKDGLPEPPPFVVPGLAWRGRVTLLAAREGLGKSTLFAAAAAAVTQGTAFLGGDLASPKGVVLWVLVEEHADDFVIRAAHFAGPGGDGLDLLRYLERPEDALATLRAEVERVAPALVIVDTLHAFAGPMVEHASQADDWQTVMDAFREVANAGPAVLMAAQASKSTGDYRDSTAIGHGVDVVLTLKRFEGEGPDGVTRELAVLKRRFPVARTTYQLAGATTRADGSVHGGVLRRVGQGDVAARREAEQAAGDARDALRWVAANGPLAAGASPNPRGGQPPFGMSKARMREAAIALGASGHLQATGDGWALTPLGAEAAQALPPAPRENVAARTAAALDANEAR